MNHKAWEIWEVPRSKLLNGEMEEVLDMNQTGSLKRISRGKVHPKVPS